MNESWYKEKWFNIKYWKNPNGIETTITLVLVNFRFKNLDQKT